MRSSKGSSARGDDTLIDDGSAPAEPWHALEVEEVLRHLESTPTGLSGAEAAERLRTSGPNVLKAAKRTSAGRILMDQFRSVVMVLLLAAAVVAFLLGDPVDAAAIVAVLIINVVVGFTTELRARKAVAALLELEVPHAVVLRDGEPTEIDARELVPGDAILLEAGQSVPADARLIAATELRVTEASLTGESQPVDKDASATLDPNTPLADRTDLVYMSTAVVAGSAKAVVVGTGMRTELGRIGGLVSEIEEERTPLERRLDMLGRRLVWLVLGVAVLVVAIGMLRGEEMGRLVETALALAIAAVPEGLPAVSTIALAVGVSRMARRNAVVRRLPAVEALGSATVICTDKTGTLTAGEMTVTLMVVGMKEYRLTGTGYTPEGEILDGDDPVVLDEDSPLQTALRIGALNNRAALEQEGGGGEIRGDPTEAALLVAAAKAGLDPEALRHEWPEVGEVPFSSERMLMATFHRGAEGDRVYAKGAPARVIERCDRILLPDGPVSLDPAMVEEVNRWNTEMASRGLRVLALAEGAAAVLDETALHDLILVGLAGISDPPAEGVRDTVTRFTDAGIRTVMITGDQRLTASAIARELGIASEGDEVLGGAELADLGPDEIEARMAHVSVLSRVSPEDKLRVIEALQHRGEIVAMLGDGVNDAAALKRADIGVAMGIRGTDVAREAADVVLQDDRFQTIGVAVEQGRIIFDNIRKFVFYLFSCNLAEVFVILCAGLIGLPQPLLPLQILWLNLVTDTFPALSLAMEPGQEDIMRRSPRDPDEAILSAPFLRSIAFFALLITGTTLTAFIWALNATDADPARAVTVAFMTLALAQTFHLANARDEAPVLTWRRATSNRWALAAVAVTVSLQFAAVYLPALAGVLGVVPLSLRDWQVILPLALVPAVAGQAAALLRTSRRALTPV